MEQFDSNSEVFDDFKPAEEQGAFVNETIGNVIERELTEVEQFKEDFDEQLLMADNPKDDLTQIIIGYVQGCGDVNHVNICSYKSKNGVALDGWSFSGDEDLTTIDLFLTIYEDPNNGSNISANDLDRQFNWLQRFYDQSVSGAMLGKFMDDTKSDLYQVADLIHSTNKIDRIRLFILTNAIAPVNYEKDNIEIVDGTSCEFYVWDAKRIMQQDNIISGRKPIVVDFEGDYNCTLPCIKMPDVSDHVMCYLCIIPGMVLSQVYHKYHQQILEMNVRTFLQFKGASNKGIRDTLIGHTATAVERRKGVEDTLPEPDMFFAYNNGISATASDVKLNEEGTAITEIKSWQIVNGGQTTAAISAVMGMKDVDYSKLASVYVAMKISVVKDKDSLSEIVPKISRFANTQSAVKKSDFNINEGFLVELEHQSRETWVLNTSGKPVSKWFFERTRGQYLDKAKRQNSSKAEKEFYAEYPKNQMFDKTTLSKFVMSWEQDPASVCKGGENNYTKFFDKMKRTGAHFDKTRYQRTIAKAILFKGIDALYGKDGLALPGYKSNMVAYTMSLLSLKSNRALNLDAIWNEQCVISPSVYNELTLDIYNVYAKLLCGAEHITYKIKESYTDANGRRKNRYVPKEIPQEDIERLKATMLYKVLLYVKNIEPFVYKHLIDVDEGKNINEWTKSTLCWGALKTKLSQEGDKYNVPAELLGGVGDVDEEITEGQKKKIDEAKGVDSEKWFSLSEWSKDNPGKLTPKEQAFIGQLVHFSKEGRNLSYKLSKWALDLYEKALEAGWNEK
ncbi:AIPR family protein [Segatella copri]|uniref:AIPR family protein n=1 Tax=Segatella copri TaxID=165179 RepID=UPI001182DACD|nr:AIPR family protein [Segatella copri]